MEKAKALMFKCENVPSEYIGSKLSMDLFDLIQIIYDFLDV